MSRKLAIMRDYIRHKWVPDFEYVINGPDGIPSEQVKPPRVVTTQFPFGAPLGDPHNTELHRRVVLDALQALVTAEVPGTIIDLPCKWREAVS